MASGTILRPSGIERRWPSGISETSTVTEVLQAAKDNFIYLFGGWQKPGWAPLQDANHQWNFILFKTVTSPLNYTQFIAICSDGVANSSAGVYLYNYSSGKWIKLSHTVL